MESWEGLLLPDMYWINKLGEPYSFFFDEIAKMPGVVIDKERSFNHKKETYLHSHAIRDYPVPKEYRNVGEVLLIRANESTDKKTIESIVSYFKKFRFLPFNSFNLNGFTFSHSHTTPLTLDYEFVVGDYRCVYNVHNLDNKEIKKSSGLICDLISIKLENKL